MDTSLKAFNTLGINAHCQQLVEITNTGQLRLALADIQEKQQSFLVLGSGSNLVFSKDMPGVVLHMATKGIEVIEQDSECVVLSVAAGEIWDNLVSHCIKSNYFGMENLSGIPGTVGAAPVQNIGAYGIELEQFLVSVDAIEVSTGKSLNFSHADCKFAYRDSLFKRSGAGRYIITHVRLKLFRDVNIKRNLSYKGLVDEFNKQGLINPSASTVRRVIKEIRGAKLPDPAVLPNAGSFFKNPVVSEQVYLQLLEQYPDIASFSQRDGQIKLAASWMIENAGWKGFREDDAGVFEKHALILVNHGCATGSNIISLAKQIQDSVFERFAVSLEIEPTVI